MLTKLFARLPLFSRPRPRRARRHWLQDPDLALAAEQLEWRIVLSPRVASAGVAASSSVLPFNDSRSSPGSLASETQMPNLPVFNVMNYGAKGDGKTDDTVSIRSAIAAASAAGGGIIFFPAGTYDVAPQRGDTSSAIFAIKSSNLVFLGVGANQSILSGYMPGLANPATHWNVTGDPYEKISRFGMFLIDSSLTHGPISNIEFRSLNLDGNAGYTGNFTVGGDPATGDGWDLSNKAINMNGPYAINNVLVINTTIDNWRGEEVYGGGLNVGTVYLINDDIYGTNASAVSVSGNLLIDHTTIGGSAPGDDVYNGVENFDLGAPQQTVIQYSTIEDSSNPSKLHGNGIVYLGLATSSLTVQDSTIENNWEGVLFSEAGHNVNILSNTFTNNLNAMITSVLGLYPQYPTGFSNFLIQRNSFSHSGAAFLSQDYGGSYSFNGLVLNSNTVTYGTLLDGGFAGAKWNNFVVENNVLGAGASDIGNPSSYVGSNYALWINNTRLDATSFASAGVRVDDYSSSNTTVIDPITDETVLNVNSHPNGVQYVTINPATMKDYPVGFTTTLRPWSMSNWVLVADPTWNTFTSNIPIGPNGVTIQVNAQGLFQIVSSRQSAR